MALPRNNASSWVTPRYGARMNGRNQSRTWFVPTRTPRVSSAWMALSRTCLNLLPHSVARKASRWFQLTLAAFGSAACLCVAALFLSPAFLSAQSKSGVDLSAIDKAVDPCNDFYQYACGGWIKSNPIPPEEATWGRFDLLQENNEKILRSIAEDAAAHPDKSPIAQKVGDFYQSCINEDVIEKFGATPLRPELDRIAAIANRADLVAEVAHLHTLQVQVFFNFGPSPDPNDAKMNIPSLDQGGLGLPEKDFYFRTDAHSEEIRQKYVTHIAKMLALSGTDCQP